MKTVMMVVLSQLATPYPAVSPIIAASPSSNVVRLELERIKVILL